MPEMKIFSGNSNLPFAKKVAQCAGVPLGQSQVSRFKDGEVQVEIKESVRGSNVFVIQSTSPPVNENYMELFIMLDALKRASSKEITSVIPYYGYSRQDRKVVPRAPISAKAIAKLLNAVGSDRLVSVDLHSSQIQGFFDGPVDHLFATPCLAEAWEKVHGKGNDFVIVSPDAGGVERARAFAKRIHCPIAIIDKRRSGPNEAKAFHVIGNVKNKTAIIVDDMIDTANTLIEATRTILKKGAKKVSAVCSHPIFSGPALKNINEGPLDEVWVTDTITLSQEAKKCPKLKTVTVAPLVAEALKRISTHESVSALFD